MDSHHASENPAATDSTTIRTTPRTAGTRFESHGSGQAQRLLLLTIRLLFLVLLVTVSLLPFVGQISEMESATLGTYIVPFILTLAFGIAVILIDVATPQKRLATVFGIYFGIVAGLVGTLGIGVLLDLVAESWDLQPGTMPRAYVELLKLAIGIALCYLAVSIVLTTKDDLRLVIPYVEFAKQVRGVRPLLIDTSVLIDGRITSLCQTGMLDAPLIVPQFVVDELQTLADSADKLKRDRGRRGLGVVTRLQQNPLADVSIDSTSIPGGRSVDNMLLRLAAAQNMRILTTDYNLNKVADIQGVTVLNLNDLATALKSQIIPGEHVRIEIVKRGESPDQGVGYLPDGTMIVVQNAAQHIGSEVDAVITNSLQTAAGKLFFADLLSDEQNDQPTEEPPQAATESSQSRVSSSSIADAATNQPRATDRPTHHSKSTRRNPRR